MAVVGTGPAPTTGSLRAQIVEAAIKALNDSAGNSYQPGGKTTAGFDCSGFVSYVYNIVVPEYVYMDTEHIASSSSFQQVTTKLPGDLIFFPKGKNPYEVAKNNNREFGNHVGIILDGIYWIGSQNSTGVAKVKFTNPWWKDREQRFLRYKTLPPA